MNTLRSFGLTVVIASAALAGCDAAVVEPSSAPTDFVQPKPAIQLDQTWTAANGEWTFTGFVDPHGDPTEVVLEVGPGPATARQFDGQVEVVSDLTDSGPISVTTRQIPDIAEICVRFAATNSGGTSVTTPLCVPHDLPTSPADAEPPTVTFSAPATGTMTDLSAASFTVTWAEADAGSGVNRRSLQRRVAAYTCGDFEDDGPPVTDPSPVTVSELADGMCYVWVATVTDRAGNASAITSGTVRVRLASP